ncbi:MAG: SpoIIE family protein phosphatase [bacterium]|nr:SpoIIE family protein phosphatase [bacterium]
MTQEVNHTRTEKLLLEAARVFNSTLEYEKLMELILKLVMTAVGSEAALVFRVDHLRTDMKIRLMKVDSEEMTIFNRELGMGLVGWVARHKEPAIVNSPEGDPRIDTDLGEKGGIEVRSLLSVPLIGKGQMIGVIEAINKEDGQFTKTDLDVLTGLSNQMAVAIDNANLYRQLQHQISQKDALNEIGRKLSGTLQLDEMLPLILESVGQVVQFDAGGIFITHTSNREIDVISSIGYDPEHEKDLHLKMGEGLVGRVADTGQAIIANDVKKDDRYIDLRLETCSELVLPIKFDDRVVGVLNLESNHCNAYSKQDIDILTAFASQAAVSIERATVHQQLLDGKRLTEQLNIAREIQRAFLPEGNPEIDNYDIAGLNTPSEQVGGDYYDFIKIVGHQTGIAVADVSGKGIPAALLMASFRASLIAEIRNSYAISTICQKVNNLMYESVIGGRFVTAVYGVLDSKNHIFTFSNCGHNLPVLLRANGEIVYLEEGGQIMGVTTDVTYEERPLFIGPGDTIFMYTDGVSEVFDRHGEEYGLDRLIEVLKSTAKKSAAETLDEIYSRVRSFAAPDHIFDDFTAIIMKRD